jgi:hypothetical protein
MAPQESVGEMQRDILGPADFQETRILMGTHRQRNRRHEGDLYFSK